MRYLSLDELQFKHLSIRFYSHSRKEEYIPNPSGTTYNYSFDIHTGGTAKYHINGEDTEFLPGSIFFRKPGDKAFQYLDHRYQCYAVNFSISKKETGERLNPEEESCFLDFIPTYTEPDNFSDIVKTVMDFPEQSLILNDEEKYLKQEIAFRKFLLLMYPLSQINNNHNQSYVHPAVKKAISFFYANADTPITMKEASDYAGISEKYFQQLFKNQTGKTPNDYFMGIRLQIAVKKLLTTEMSISEIAYESGFANSGYFTRIFKKYYHQTPSEFRKK